MDLWISSILIRLLKLCCQSQSLILIFEFSNRLIGSYSSLWPRASFVTILWTQKGCLLCELDCRHVCIRCLLSILNIKMFIGPVTWPCNAISRHLSFPFWLPITSHKGISYFYLCARMNCCSSLTKIPAREHNHNRALKTLPLLFSSLQGIHLPSRWPFQIASNVSIVL